MIFRIFTTNKNDIRDFKEEFPDAFVNIPTGESGFFEAHVASGIEHHMAVFNWLEESELTFEVRA